MRKIPIDNSKESAVTSKSWEPDKKALIAEAEDAMNTKTLIHEIFLKVDKNRGPVVYNTGLCKYPHHEFVDGTLVLNIKGVQAAYARLKQQGEYEGDQKKHIDGHRKELGLDIKDQKLEEAARSIDSVFNLLQEVISPPKPEEKMDNMFEEFLTEKPVITPGDGGNPLPQDQSQQAAPAAPTDPNVQSQPAVAAAPIQDPNQVPQPDPTSTIPVQNVDPTEDTSTNNPYEGPDSRDPDNLDGNARKEQYQNFANVLKEVDNNNVFGTIFDEDIFKSEYKIVPYEMRYFYRLQNPVSVNTGDLAFIPFGEELLKAQEKHDLGKKMFVFATYSDKPVFFNMLDKTIWYNDKKVSDTFDGFVDKIVEDNGRVDLTEDTEGTDANVDYSAAGEQPTDPLANDSILGATEPQPGAAEQTPSDMAPMDLGAAPAGADVNTGLGNTNAPASGAAGMAPMDLSQTNASLEADSILDMLESKDFGFDENDPSEDLTYINPDILKNKQKNKDKKAKSDLLQESTEYMTEGVAFPNDALDARNRQDAANRERRKMGFYMID